MNIDDPIFAAIEAHQHACAETCAAYERQSAVADELAARDRGLAGGAANDPRSIAANDAAGKALVVQDDLAVKLLETQPTTIAGAAALLSYYVDAIETERADAIFPGLDVNGRLVKSMSTDNRRRDFAYFLVRNVAAVLNNMAGAQED